MEFDNIENLKKVQDPVIILHAEDDKVKRPYIFENKLKNYDLLVTSKPGVLDLSRRGLDLDIVKQFISTVEKILTFSKVCLNSREILIEIKKSQFCLDINVHT